MTEHDLAELRDIKSMIETPGWTAFSRRHREQADSLRLNGWNSIRTIEQLHYMKGFLEALESVANYDRIIEAAEKPDSEQLNLVPDSI